MPTVTGVAPAPRAPSGEVAPDFEFRARVEPPSADDPIKVVRVEVRHANPKRAGAWASGWVAAAEPRDPGRVRLANPGQPAVPARQPLRWRMRTRSSARVLSPWSDWVEFTITHAAPSVEVRPAGTVRALTGRRLRADVRRPTEATSIVAYEIELAERASQDVTHWESPLWSAEGGPLVPRTRPKKDDVSDELRFDALEGRPTRQGMVVDRRRPLVRVRASRPITAYTWKLVQHGDLVKDASEVTGGISADGTCLSFRLPILARRGPGYFAPPFDRRKGTYRGETYKPGNPSNPLGHSAYAIDHNRGAGGDDAGDPVLAAAGGRVVELDPARGKVVIRHYGGAYQTEYGHLRLPFEVRIGQEVEPLERIGSIGATGAGAFHLHHAHYVKLTRGPHKGHYKPTRMRFGGKPCKASRAGPDVHSPPYLDWKSDFEGFEPGGFRGWTNFDPAATLSLRVRFEDGTRSKAVRLRFFVGRRPDSDQGAIDAGCRGTGLAEGTVPLLHRYDGPRLSPGEYSIRYRCRDDLGNVSPWAMDHSLVVAG